MARTTSTPPKVIKLCYSTDGSYLLHGLTFRRLQRDTIWRIVPPGWHTLLLIRAIPSRKYVGTNGNCKKVRCICIGCISGNTLVTNHCYRERHVVGRDKLYGDGSTRGSISLRWIGWTRQKLRYLVKLTEIKFPTCRIASIRIVTKAVYVCIRISAVQCEFRTESLKVA